MFKLDFRSAIPVYLQLVERVREGLASGDLKPGDQLPSIRALAEELRLNRNTVAKAYAELERGGLARTEPGRGVFCSRPPAPASDAAGREELARAVDAVIVRAYHLRVGADALRKIFEERLVLLANRPRPGAEPARATTKPITTTTTTASPALRRINLEGEGAAARGDRAPKKETEK